MHIILGTMTFGGQVDDVAASEMLDGFTAAGHRQLDTAYVYCKGETEKLLGRIIAPERRADLYLAGKVNPWNDEGLQPGQVRKQLLESLDRLRTDHLDLLYLHSPDLDTPVIDTLRACNDLYREGRFKALGLSNYAAWQVAQINEICIREGWPRPVVYQGMYNALTRDVERELFPCLRDYEMGFNVYNPLAGGMLTGKHQEVAQLPEAGRFATFDGYPERYWQPLYFAAVERFREACADAGISPSQAALRWLTHHSLLSDAAGDGIILGASRLSHLTDNLAATHADRLPDPIVAALDEGWETVRPACIKYFRP